MRTNTALLKATMSVSYTRVQTVGNDPVLAMQQAWTVFRLPELHELTRTAIAHLRAADPRELLGRELSDVDLSECSPVTEALEACCAELRAEAGMPLADAHRQGHCSLVAGYIERQPAAWGERFNEALAKYRSAAAMVLHAAVSERASA
jgi:hypothetical protein